MSAEHKKFISTKEASSIVGRTSDYVGRLAREGKIPASRIGRSWVVEKKALLEFFDIKEAVKEIKRESLSKERKIEYKKVQAPKVQDDFKNTFAKGFDKLPFENAAALALTVLIVFGGYSLAGATGISSLPFKLISAVHERASDMHRVLARSERHPELARANYVVAQNKVSNEVKFEANNIFATGFAEVESFGNRFKYTGVQKSFASTYVPGRSLMLPNSTDMWNGYKALGEGLVVAAHGSVDAYTGFVKYLGKESLSNALAVQNIAQAASANILNSYEEGLGAFVVLAQEIPKAQAELVYGFVDGSFVLANTLASVPYNTGGAILASAQSIPEANIKIGSSVRENSPKLGRAIISGYVDFIYNFVDSTYALTDTYKDAIESTGDTIGTGYAYARFDLPTTILAGANSGLDVSTEKIVGMVEFAGERIAANVFVPAVETVMAVPENIGSKLAGVKSPLATNTTEKVEEAQANVIGGVAGGVRDIFDRIFGRKKDPVLLVNPGPAQTNVVIKEDEPVYVAPRNVTQNFFASTDVNRLYVDSSITALHAALSAEIQKLTAANRNQIVQNVQTIQWVNKIEDISDTIIRRPEVIGGFLRGVQINEGSSFTGTTVDANAFTGGTANFATTTISDLTVTNNITAGGTLTVGGLTSNGVLTGPYFSATSTTATSTFAGSFAIDTDGFVYATSTGNVGIGVLSPSSLLSLQNATNTQPIATFADDGGSEVFRFTNGGYLGIGTTSPYEALSVVGNGAFTGNLTAATTTLSGDLTGTNAVFTNGTTTNATSTNLFATNATLTNIIGTSATITNATTTNFYTSVLSAVTSTLTNLVATNATTTNATSTQLAISSLTSGRVPYVTTDGRLIDDADLTFNGTRLTATDLVATNATSTNLYVSGDLTTGLTQGSIPFIGSNGLLTQDNSNFFFDNTNNRLGIGTTSPYAKLSVVGQAVAEYFTATSTSVASTFPELTSTNATTTGTFSAASGGAQASGLTVLANGYVGINDTTPEFPLDVTVSASKPAIFRATTEPRVRLVAGGSNVGLLNGYTGDSFRVYSSSGLPLHLGYNETTQFEFSSGQVDSSVAIIPTANATYDLGSPAYYWDDAYFDSATINNLSSASTSIAGTNNASFSINSDNATSDAEDASLIFYRGVVVPNAVIGWDASEDRFDFNQNIFIQNDNGSTGTSTVTVRAASSQTGNLFTVQNNAGLELANFDVNGYLGLGSSSPSVRLTVGTGTPSSLSAANYYNSGYVTGDLEVDGTIYGTVSGAVTPTGFTEGSVAFAGSGGTLSQDNDNFFWNDSANRLGIGTATPATSVDIKGTDAIRIPVGTSAQRPSTELTGQIRYNSDTTQYEGYNGSNWLGLGGVIDIDQDTYVTAEESSDEDFLRFYTGGTERVTINSSGNVGIGTTSPETALDVYGTVQSSGATPNFWQADSFASGLVHKLASENAGYSISVDSGNVSSSSYFRVLVDSDEKIRVDDNGDFGVGDASPDFRLETVGTSTSGYFGITNSTDGDILTVDTSGNFGIGTTSPYAKLSVVGQAVAEYFTATTTSATSTLPNLSLTNLLFGSDYINDITGNALSVSNGVLNVATSSLASGFFQNGGNSFGASAVLGTNDSNSLAFETNNSTRVTIDTSGNVGIGTSTDLGTGLTLDSGKDITIFEDDSNLSASILSAGSFGGKLDLYRVGSPQIVLDSASGVVFNEQSIGHSFRIESLSDEYAFYIPSDSNNVGIGTSTPTDKLTVQGGDIVLNEDDGELVAARIGAGTLSGNFSLYNNSATPSIYLNAGSGNDSYFNVTSGNVGIGTTSPASRLTVSEGGTNGAIQEILTLDAGTQNLGVAGSGTVIGFDYLTTASAGGVGAYGDGTNPGIGIWGGTISGDPELYVNSTGNVGIGTTTPDTLLHLYANAAATRGLTLQNANTGASGDIYTRWIVGDETQAYTLGIDNSDSDTFKLTDGASPSAGNVFLAVDSSGNVGIGTSSPTKLFSVDGGDAIIHSAGSLTELTLSSTNGNSSSVTFQEAGAGKAIAGWDGTNDVFKINGQTASFTSVDHFVVDTSGNVGIGTPSPGAKLEISDGGVIVQDTSFANSTTRPSVAGGTTIGDYEIRGVGDTDAGDHGFLRLRAGGGTNANAVSYIDISGYSTASDVDKNITFGTAGSERVRIDSSGNVGIGTTTPTNKLSIYTGNTTNANEGITLTRGSAGAPQDTQLGFRLKSDTGGTYRGAITVVNGAGASETEAITIERTGNIGIGTTTPQSLLHTYGSSGDNVKFEITDAPSNVVVLRSSASPAADTNLGRFNFKGLDSAGNETGYARVDGYVADSTDGSEDGYLTFTTATAGSLTEKVRIDENGNVGVGTSSPSALLHVSEDAAGNAFLVERTAVPALIQSEFGGGDSAWYHEVNTGGTSYLQGIDDGDSDKWKISYGSAGDAAFGTNDYFTLDQSGNVGIGTSTPERLLSVTGGVAIDSAGATDTEYINFTASGGTTIGGIGRDTNDIVLSSPFGIRLTEAGTDVLNVAGGNVGIGTSTPGYLLDVDGDFNVGEAGNAQAFYVDATAGRVAVGENAHSLTNLDGKGIIITNTAGGATGRLRLDVEDITSGYNTEIRANDTGLALEAASNSRSISLWTGATPAERLTVLGTGNVGINDSTPDAQLDVVSASTIIAQFEGPTAGGDIRIARGTAYQYDLGLTGSSVFYIEDASGNTPFQIEPATPTDTLYLDSTGNVGIGTTSPTSLLTVSSASGNATAKVHGGFSGGTSSLTIETVGDTSTGSFLFQKSGVSRGAVGYSHASTGAAERLSFTVSGGAHLNVLGSGNVGIGTTSPAGNLHTTAGGSGTIYFPLGNELIVEDNADAGIAIAHPTANKGYLYFTTPLDGDSAYIEHDGTNRYLALGTVGTEALRIDNSQNVGIGTSSPASRLTVSEGGTNGAIQEILTLDAGTQNLGVAGSGTVIGFDYLTTGSAGGVGAYGNGTGPGIGIWGQTISGDPELYVNSTGDVGIGTTSPQYQLDVYGNGDTGIGIGNIGRKKTITASTVSPYDILTLTSNGSTGTWRGAIDLDLSYNGGSTFTALRAVANTDGTTANVGIGEASPDSLLHLTGNDPTLTFEDTGGSPTGAWSLRNTDDTFRIRDATTGADRVTVDASGNVGIGDTTPGNPLEINTTNKLGATFENATAGEGVRVTQTDYSAGNYVSLIESSYDDSNAAPNARIAAMFDGGGSNIAIGTSNSYGSGITNTAIWIDSIGRVGVGTTSEIAPFAVDSSTISGEGYRSTVHFENDTYESALTLRGTGSGFLHAGINLIASSGSNVRALGVTGYDQTSQRGWFWGRPYSSSDAFAINRRSTTGFSTDVADTNDADVDNFFYINSSGNVGIGNDSPSATQRLLVEYTPTGTFTEVANTAYNHFTVRGNNNGYAGITVASPNSGAEVGAIAFADEKHASAGLISYDHTSNDLSFYASTTARLYIDGNDGYVGIGDTTPGAMLDINDDATTGTGIRVYGGGSGGPLATFVRDVGSSGSITIDSSGGDPQISFDNQTVDGDWTIGNDSSTDDLYFAASSDLVSNIRTVITQEGNVGIGTTSPETKLQVSGGNILLENTYGLQIEDSAGANRTLVSFNGSDMQTFGTTNNNATFQGFDVGFNAARSASGGADEAFLFTATNDLGVNDEVFQVADGGGNLLTVLGTGNVGIGTASPDSIKLDVEDDIEIGTGTTGCVRDADNTTLTGTCVSDERLKKNIQDLDPVLDRLAQLRGVTFEWRNDEFEWLNGQAGTNYGLIAQEVEAVFPEMVQEDDRGYKRVSYDTAFTTRLLQGIIELDEKLESRIGANGAIAIDALGNIGIGTTTPAYKLHVLGDAAATSFVNISTREEKKGIAYLDEARKDDILSKLKAVQIAEYRYNFESDDNPLRLGLIAEEAPSEVLSVSGKGVDIYKLATFTLASVQEIALKLETLEERIAALEASGVVAGSGGVFSTTTLKSAFAELGVLIEKGFAQFDALAFKQLIAQKDEGGEAAAGTGTIYAGNKLVLVENSQIKASSKVFITFTSPVVGSWFITDKANGSFRVTLDQVQNTDVTFDYFIVQTERDVAPTSDTGVVDTEEPVITIIGANPYYIATGTAYVEPGVTITDNVDQNLTYTLSVDGYSAETHPLDTSVAGEHVLTYKVLDTAGNLTTATRSVVVGADASLTSLNTGTSTEETTATTTPAVVEEAPVVEEEVVVEEAPVDEIAPVISLVGAAAIEITVGDSFTDEGATAVDETDGDITPVVSGTVDTATAGLYTLTYTATDTAGNEASVSRIVTVVAVETPEAPVEDVVE